MLYFLRLLRRLELRLLPLLLDTLLRLLALLALDLSEFCLGVVAREDILIQNNNSIQKVTNNYKPNTLSLTLCKGASSEISTLCLVSNKIYDCLE